MGFAVALNGTGDRMASGAPSGDGHAYVFDRQMAANAVAWNGTNWVAGGTNWVAGGNSVSTGESATSSALVSSTDGLNWQAVSPYTVNAAPLLTKQYFGEFPTQILGYSMAFNAAGTRLAIGAPGDTSGNSAVYIYDYDSSLNRWPDTYTKKFLPQVMNTAVPLTAFFGISVSLNAAGDRLAVGEANPQITPTFAAGSVYIYHMTNQQWPSTPTWSYVGTTPNPHLGCYVKFNAKGDRLLVSSQNNAQTPTTTSYLYIFHYGNSSWPGSNGGTAAAGATQYYANINGSIYNGLSLQYFWPVPYGFNAAGDRIAISSYLSSGGQIYMLHYNPVTGLWPGTRGTSVANWCSAYYNGLAGDLYFGLGVELSAVGDKLAVAAVGNNTGGGRVYLIEYNYSTNTWPGSNGTTAVTITSSIYTAYYDWTPTMSNFGSNMHFNAAGTRLLVGTAIINNNNNPGVLAVFDRNPNTGWPASGNTLATATYLIYGDDSLSSSFGWGSSISADGTRIAGGRYSSSLFGNKRGYVNIYDLSSKIQLQQCAALTTALNNNTLAAGQGGSTVFSASTNGTSWNNIIDDRNVFYSGGDGRTLVRTQALQDPSGITLGQNYGTAVALNQSGTRLAVSVINNSSGQGQVLIYNSTPPEGWTNSQRLTCPDTAVKFGLALSLNAAGTKLLIGAPQNAAGGTSRGDVYSYTYSNGLFVLDDVAKITRPDVNNAFFGSALAMNAAGSKLVVGAPGGTITGKVYCYNYDAQYGWVADAMTSVLEPSPITGQLSGFGRAVAMNAAGTQLTVGEPNYTFTTDINGGKVSCYTYSTLTGWQKTQDLSGNTSWNYENFGSTLALNSLGTRLVVGAPNSSTVGLTDISGGKVYSYNNVNSAWVFDISLNGTPYNNTRQAQFGGAVALNSAGDRLSIGAPYSAQPQVAKGGQVYNYVYTNTWQRQFDLSGSVGGGLEIQTSGTSGVGFGAALALNGLGNRLIVGDPSYNATSATYATGIAYSYDEPFALRQANAVAANSSLVVAGGKSISNPLAYSLDNGQTWAESVSGGPNLFAGPDVSANLWGLLQNASYKQCNAVAWNGSKWVAGGLGGVAYSYDGLNWLPNSFAGFRTCNAIVWNGTNWLASGILAGGQQGQATSTDGITWTVNSVGVALGNALAVRGEQVEGNYFANATQIAIGAGAGYNQGSNAVAIGLNAGQTNQGSNAVAIGAGAGYNQGSNAVAIGLNAGQTNQGSNAVAIGAGAGQTNQGSNSIVLNATGAALSDISANTLVVKPIRNQNGALPSYASLFYNGSTGEVISNISNGFSTNYAEGGNWTANVAFPSTALTRIAFYTIAIGNFGTGVTILVAITVSNPGFANVIVSRTTVPINGYSCFSVLVPAGGQITCNGLAGQWSYI
jgi:hypothetical protein